MLGLSKKNITIILTLTCLTLLCGCQKKEKTIYMVSLSEHAMELERQERAYNDSLEKYSALLNTAHIRYYFDLHKAVLDTLSVVTQQEVNAFIAAKDREAANYSIYNQLLLNVLRVISQKYGHNL